MWYILLLIIILVLFILISIYILFYWYFSVFLGKKVNLNHESINKKFSTLEILLMRSEKFNERNTVEKINLNRANFYLNKARESKELYSEQKQNVLFIFKKWNVYKSFKQHNLIHKNYLEFMNSYELFLNVVSNYLKLSNFITEVQLKANKKLEILDQIYKENNYFDKHFKNYFKNKQNEFRKLIASIGFQNDKANLLEALENWDLSRDLFISYLRHLNYFLKVKNIFLNPKEFNIKSEAQLKKLKNIAKNFFNLSVDNINYILLEILSSEFKKNAKQLNLEELSVLNSKYKILNKKVFDLYLDKSSEYKFIEQNLNTLIELGLRETSNSNLDEKFNEFDLFIETWKKLEVYDNKVSTQDINLKEINENNNFDFQKSIKIFYQIANSQFINLKDENIKNKYYHFIYLFDKTNKILETKKEIDDRLKTEYFEYLKYFINMIAINEFYFKMHNFIKINFAKNLNLNDELDKQKAKEKEKQFLASLKQSENDINNFLYKEAYLKIKKYI